MTGCQDSRDEFLDTELPVVREACVAAKNYESQFCELQCFRLANAADSAACAAACGETVLAPASLCNSPLEHFSIDCSGSGCAGLAQACRAAVSTDFAQCNRACGEDEFRCISHCLSMRAIGEQHCGFLPAEIMAGSVPVPVLDVGEPAFLPGLLDAAEIAVVEAADLRAESLRSRSVRFWTGQPATPVRITQLEHDFTFGVPLDIREFEDAEDNLAFYGEIARKHATLLVAETSLKWRNVEREEGVYNFDLADIELDWAE